MKLLLLIPLLFFISCKQKYSYAINNFRKEIQPCLTNLVTTGIVDYKSECFKELVTNSELLKLSRSEHPILRAYAFREIGRRKDMNCYELMMGHLDDTAIVNTTNGEFGLQLRTVSDDILDDMEWKTQDAKNKTIDEVIIKHNYLRSAYTILKQIVPQEKYYSSIKEMAIRKIKYNEELGEQKFMQSEYALEALAKFKKKIDIPIIVERLSTNLHNLSAISFAMMKENPDTAYMSVFEAYYPSYFKRRSYQYVYGGYEHELIFLKCIATYKNERSAKILSDVLSKKPCVIKTLDSTSFKQQLMEVIVDNNCTAYYKLTNKIKSTVLQNKKESELFTLPIDTSISNLDLGDTSKRKIVWWMK